MNVLTYEKNVENIRLMCYECTNLPKNVEKIRLTPYEHTND